jgi:hypothetical protein
MRFKPAITTLASDMRMCGFAYTYHKACGYWNPIKALWVCYVASRMNRHLAVTRYSL